MPLRPAVEAGLPLRVVLDENGAVRWRHSVGETINTAELEQAVTGDTPAPWTRREFVATVFGAAAAVMLKPKLARAGRRRRTAQPLVSDVRRDARRQAESPTSERPTCAVYHATGKRVRDLPIRLTG